MKIKVNEQTVVELTGAEPRVTNHYHYVDCSFGVPMPIMVSTETKASETDEERINFIADESGHDKKFIETILYFSAQYDKRKSSK